MTTEPTQTPSVPMPLADIKPTSADEAIHRLHDSERRRMKDRDEATQRIAELEQANSELLARLEKRVQDFNATDKARLDEVGRLRQHCLDLQAGILGIVGEYMTQGSTHERLEEAMRKAMDAQQKLRTEPLSPSPPAVEVERWAKEKAHFAKGGRVQFMEKGFVVWQTWKRRTQEPPIWENYADWRIHPDDTPPVQPEEKALYDFKASLAPELRRVFEGYQESLADAPQTEEKPATVPHLRWHRLSELTRDDVGTIELLAATSVDGIGCIARWSRLEEGGWEVSAMDTEGDSGMVPITDFTEEAVPPEPPTMFDDLASTEVVPATVPLAVAEKLVQELQNIADAKPSTWGDMQDQFQPWA